MRFGFESCDCQFADVFRRSGNNAKQNDAALTRQTRAKGQLAKILVEREQYPVFRLRKPKNFLIAGARRFRSYPLDVVTFILKVRDSIAGNIFICEQAHYQPCNGYSFSE